MIDTLKKIENDDLLTLLEKPEIWNSLDVDYHPPKVERIWCQHGDYRIYLHFIHPCKSEEALYHSHPWPSAMHILDGTYEMSIGFGEIKNFKEIVHSFNQDEHFQIYKPRTVATLILPSGAYYDMLDPIGFHYVRPITLCKTIMITGKLFEETYGTFKANKNLESLSDDKKEEIRKWFLNYYFRQEYGK